MFYVGEVIIIQETVYRSKQNETFISENSRQTTNKIAFQEKQLIPQYTLHLHLILHYRKIIIYNNTC